MMMLLLVADGDIDRLWANQAHSFATQPRSGMSTRFAEKYYKFSAIENMFDDFSRVFLPLGILTCWLRSKEILPTDGSSAASFLERALETQDGKAEPLPPADAVALYAEYCGRIFKLLPEQYPVKVSAAPDATGGYPFWREKVTASFEKSWGHLITTRAIHQMWDVALNVTRCIILEAAKPDVTCPLQFPSAETAGEWRKMRGHADELLSTWEKPSDAAPVSLTRMFRAFESEDWQNQHTLPAILLMRALRQAWRLYLPDIREESIEWRLPRVLTRRVANDTQSGPWNDPLIALGRQQQITTNIQWADGVEYADYLIDSFRPDGFTVRPAAAKKRLVHQAVFIKTLWGISSIIRRRRLEKLMEQANKATPE